MRSLALKIAVTSAALAALGAVRLPLEQGLTAEFRTAHILTPPLDLATNEKLGQTTATVALGGLRTLVAALWNLRAFSFFEGQEWARLEDTFGTIVTLAPHTRYYWDTASWHLAYNAASGYLEDEHLPPVRRRQLWRDAIRRGQVFLERGIRNNPDDWVLPHRLGRLFDDRNKLPDLAKAADWFGYSAARGAPAYVARNQLYALGRLPGREVEALTLARRLFADHGNRLPSLDCLLLALEARAGADPAALASKIFESPVQAWSQLGIYRHRGGEGYPQDGVDSALRSLERQLNISPAESVFRPDSR